MPTKLVCPYLCKRPKVPKLVEGVKYRLDDSEVTYLGKAKFWVFAREGGSMTHFTEWQLRDLRSFEVAR